MIQAKQLGDIGRLFRLGIAKRLGLFSDFAVPQTTMKRVRVWLTFVESLDVATPQKRENVL